MARLFMKRGIPFKTSCKLALQRRWATRVITIILSVFAFSLFTLATMAYTYSRADFITRGFLNKAGGNDGYVKYELSWIDKPNDLFQNSSVLGKEVISTVEAETGKEYIYAYDTGIDIATYFPEYRNIPSNIFGGSNLLFFSGKEGVERLYEDFGFQVVAGRYPVGVNEIAINVNQFTIFRQEGYSNNFANFVKNNSDSDNYFFDTYLPTAEKEEIKEYSDLIGKTLARTGNEQIGNAHCGIHEVTIVGIVDTHCYQDGEYSRDLSRAFYSPSWRDAYFEKEDYFCTELITSPAKDYDEAKLHVETSMRLTEQFPDTYNIGANHIDYLFDTQTEDLYSAMAGAAGAVFGIFAVVLNIHLISLSAQLKQQQVGILRSMGARKTDIVWIFLLELLLIGLSVFIFSFPVCFGVYYGVLVPLMSKTYASFGVYPFVLNGWNVLILAGMSFIVPILAALLPIRNFFKQSIVDNLSGNYKKKKL